MMNASDLQKFFLGFDRMNDLFDDVQQMTSTYPRYNIVKVGQTGYRVEVAVPGWDISDLEITLDKNDLCIEGLNKKTLGDGEEYIHKGLSGKQFRRSFRVGENIKVLSAKMQNGMLMVDLEEEVPEEQKPKRIEIQ